MSLLDLKRVESYGNNMVDFYLIRDVLPSLSKLFFLKFLDENLRLSYSQACLMLGFGLQFREIEDVAKELNMEVSQCLALFTKAIKKITKNLRSIYEKEYREEIETSEKGKQLNPLKNFTGSAFEKEGKRVIKALDQQGSHVDKSMLSKRETVKDLKTVEKKTKGKKIDSRFEVDLDEGLLKEEMIKKGSFGL